METSGEGNRDVKMDKVAVLEAKDMQETCASNEHAEQQPRSVENVEELSGAELPTKTEIQGKESSLPTTERELDSGTVGSSLCKELDEEPLKEQQQQQQQLLDDLAAEVSEAQSKQIKHEETLSLPVYTPPDAESQSLKEEPNSTRSDAIKEECPAVIQQQQQRPPKEGAEAQQQQPKEDAEARSPSNASATKGDEGETREDPSEAAEDRPSLLSLPLDSLHHVASFLTPQEWCDFGVTGRSSHRVCQEIVRRVRMHGFNCATEVVSAWKLGHHEDARELASLYISSGVPIYPRCMGHSYHTLMWKMAVEAKEIVNEGEPLSPSALKAKLDPFYLSRMDVRALGNYSLDVSYLEEKTYFWLEKLMAEGDPRAQVILSPNRGVPSPGGESLGNRMMQESPIHPAKIPISIHQHLYDQHNLHRCLVDDHEGTMVTPQVSLSVDFYHPTARSSVVRPVAPNREDGWPFLQDVRGGDTDGGDSTEPVVPVEVAEALVRAGDDLGVNVAPAEQLGEGEDVDVSDRAAVDAILDEEMDPASGDENDEMLTNTRQPLPALRYSAAKENIELEIYSASLTGSPKELEEDSKELKRHMRSRFNTYKRRLEGFLNQGKNLDFEECILDFWDEFFPHSAGIHYFDRHTAVPRMSSLQKFLTRPCPKAIGIVQCEIERIKISTKGKGVSMKGRLFPTYEYRLFIRSRPHSSSTTAATDSVAPEDEDFVRKDTLLMVAKNRGRKHAECSGVMPVSTTAKKGSNNYYLYMPQQSDVDEHFNKVNETEVEVVMNPNGASHDAALLSEDVGSILLGRLQSNFIGTEFQIFTPRTRKRSKNKMRECSSSMQNKSVQSQSDDEYDSGMSSDTTTRRSRFGRLSLRRSNMMNESGSVDEPFSHARGRRPVVKRSMSSPDHQRSGRTSRRAIANNTIETPPAQEPMLCEEEDGAITYTANLLGSRPRIMDVCIPKVTEEGVAAADWRRYLDSCDDTDDCRMLSCFRQLLQKIENQDAGAAADGVAQNDHESDGIAAEHETEDFGLLALQNRPPWWNIELGSFVLNFGGRVSVASVKNFQLCDRRDQDRIMLQFGRISGRHSFTMDFQHPLTAVQAFSIAISSLQSKISFG